MNDQPQPSPPAGGFNPQQYDFIMNPNQPKKPLLSFGGDGKQRILIMIASVLLILTVLIVIISSFFGGTSNTERLSGIAQQQTEIARVAEIGAAKSTNIDTKSLAISIQLTSATDQKKTIELIKKNGDKISTKELSQGENKETTDKLKSAETDGTFDALFLSIIQTMLQSYQSDLKSAYEATNGKETKQVLSEAYDNTTNILKNTTFK